MSEVAYDFAGCTAVVTGGSRGIGAGIAVALAARGARVIINGRDQFALSKVAKIITEAGGTAQPENARTIYYMVEWISRMGRRKAETCGKEHHDRGEAERNSWQEEKSG